MQPRPRRLRRWLPPGHFRLRRVPMRRLPKQLILLEWKRSRLSTRRSRERPIPIWPRRPPKKQGLVGAALASTMRSIASAVPPPAAASTDEAAAKAAYLARLDAEPPFDTKKQVAAGATLAWTMRSIASMASAMPLPAATSTDEAAAKAAYLAGYYHFILLEWKRSRLSTRRSKSWRVQLWP